MTPPTRQRTNADHGADGRLRRPLHFEPPFALASRLVGVSPAQSGVEVDDDELVASFGPWTVRTPLANVDSVDLTGPYPWVKVIGPPHLSLRDRGLTFAGSTGPGVCIHFARPVRGIDPLGLVRHPALTVTVEEPERFVEDLRRRLPEPVLDDVDDAVAEIEQESHDELEAYTAAELRAIARAEGISGVSKLKKDDLIRRIEAAERQVD